MINFVYEIGELKIIKDLSGSNLVSLVYFVEQELEETPDRSA